MIANSGDVRFAPECQKRTHALQHRSLRRRGEQRNYIERIKQGIGYNSPNPVRHNLSLATSRKFGRCRRTMQVCLLSPQHQYCKNDRDEEERGHISYQMTAFRRVIEGLDAHDRPVHYA